MSSRRLPPSRLRPRAADDPFVFLDLTATMRVNESLDVIVRPWARRLPGGDWDVALLSGSDPLSAASTVCGSMPASSRRRWGWARSRCGQDLNPAVGIALLLLRRRCPGSIARPIGVQLLSGGYPLGAMVSSSGSWWDARGGVTDGTPARYRNVFASDNPAPAAQLIAGAGVTPRPASGSASAGARRLSRARRPDYYDTSYAAPRRRRHGVQPSRENSRSATRGLPASGCAIALKARPRRQLRAASIFRACRR